MLEGTEGEKDGVWGWSGGEEGVRVGEEEEGIDEGRK